jgi:hypothetical protein
MRDASSSRQIPDRHAYKGALVTGSLLRTAALICRSPLPQGHDCNRDRNTIGDMLAAQVVPHGVV